jgi:predicted  nucleic acid-binding Zn-ribbon protein
MNTTLCFITFLAQQVQKIQSQIQKSHEEMLRVFTTSLTAKNKTTKEVSILQEQFAREKDTYDKTIAGVKARRELIAKQVIDTMTRLREATAANGLDSIAYTELVNTVDDLKLLVRRRGDAENILEENEAMLRYIGVLEEEVNQHKVTEVESNEKLKACESDLKRLIKDLTEKTLQLADARRKDPSDEELCKIKKLTVNLTETKLQLADTKGQCRRLEQDLDDTKRQLSDKEAEHRPLVQELTDTKLQLADTKGQCRRLEQDLDDTKRQLSDKEAELLRLDEKVKMAHSELTKSRLQYFTVRRELIAAGLKREDED